jgi:hypothetical protein
MPAEENASSGIPTLHRDCLFFDDKMAFLNVGTAPCPESAPASCDEHPMGTSAISLVELQCTAIVSNVSHTTPYYCKRWPSHTLVIEHGVHYQEEGRHVYSGTGLLVGMLNTPDECFINKHKKFSIQQRSLNISRKGDTVGRIIW